MYDNNVKTDFMKTVTKLSSYFPLCKLRYDTDSITVWPKRFKFPCLTFRLNLVCSSILSVLQQ